MPSWKKVIVSGSDARISTLYTSGHVTASSHVLVEGNLTGLNTSTASFAYFTASGGTTSSFDAVDANMYFGDGGGLSNVLHTTNASTQTINGSKRFLSELTLDYGAHIKNNEGIRFDGSTADAFTTELLAEDPNQNRTIELPNADGTIALTNQLHSAVTLDTTSYDYLSLSGQAITLGRINIEEDTNLAAGSGLSLSGATISLNSAAVTGSWSSQYFNTLTIAGISGSLGDNASTIRSLTKAGISGSLGTNATLIRGLTAANISGSFTAVSHSLQARVGGIISGISGSLGPNAATIRTLTKAGISGSFTIASHSLQDRLTTEEANIDTLESRVGQSLNTTDSPVFGGLRIEGDLLAERYIVSSSVTHLTSSFSSGSTIFGDTIDDTHKFTGSLNLTGSLISTGSIDVTDSVSATSFSGIFVGALSSSAQIKDAISGSFNATSASIVTIRNTESQSMAARLANVEAGNVGDGSNSGDNTGDVTLNTGTADYLSISNQQITLGQIELSTDVTGQLAPSHLTTNDTKLFISGAFSGTSSSLATRIDNLVTNSGSFSTRITSVTQSIANLKTRMGTEETNIDNLEAKVGQSLNTSDSPVFSGLRVSGDIHAERYIVSSSVSVITSSFSSGSTIFGDTIDDTHTFTGSLLITGSVSANNLTSNNLTADSSSISSRVSTLEADPGGIFSPTGSIQSTINDVLITGSLQISSSKSETAIKAANIQNGYPTSNNWGESLNGSYFNNFTNETHVSEILRFIAGAMSHSLDVSDAAPNTKTINNVTTAFSGDTTVTKNSLFSGVLGAGHENAKLSMHYTASNYVHTSLIDENDEVIKYLIHKGFATSAERGNYGNDTGKHPFIDGWGTNIPNNISTNAVFQDYAFSVTSAVGGSSQVSSSADAQLFGLGTLSSGNANGYTVRVAASQSFSDNNTVTTPAANQNTFHTHSFVDYTQNSFGTSNGLNLTKINTSQPAVIPAAYQDGKFTSVAGPMTGRFKTAGGSGENDISASGYYRFHDIKVAVQTGSGNFNYKTVSGGEGNNKNQFYLYVGDINANITNNLPGVSIPKFGIKRSSFSYTKRSLSGAPYILTTSYGHVFSSNTSNTIFEPAYAPLNCLEHSLTSDGFNTIGTTALTNTTVNIDASGVNTSQNLVRGVIPNGHTDHSSGLRYDGEIPKHNDFAFMSSSFSFTLDSSFNNVVQTRTAQQSVNYTTNFQSTGRTWRNTTNSVSSTQITYYDATLFNQPSASGSMAIYSFAQNHDSNNLQDTTETFTGETYRIQLNNNVLDFNGDAWNITEQYNTLGSNDLQVKPSYLVDPGGSYGYWYPTNYLGAGTNISSYRYYIRRFQTDGSTYNSMTINVGAALYKWRLDTNSPGDNVSVGIIFKSFASNGGSSSTYTRIFDPSDFTGNDVGDSVGGIYNNPFSDSINKRGNPNGSVSGTTYTIPLSNADGQTLDASNNEIYVIIRYRNNPTPITGITLTFS